MAHKPINARYGINNGVKRQARRWIRLVIIKLIIVAEIVTQMAKDKDVRHWPESCAMVQLTAPASATAKSAQKVLLRSLGFL